VLCYIEIVLLKWKIYLLLLYSSYMFIFIFIFKYLVTLFWISIYIKFVLVLLYQKILKILTQLVRAKLDN